MNVAEAIAAAGDGHVSLWYPADEHTDQQRRTVDDYQSELSELLSVPVRGRSLRTDGGQPFRPDLLVRRGADDRLRSLLQGDGPRFPSPGCTTVTVYPHESSRPSLSRRLLERLTF